MRLGSPISAMAAALAVLLAAGCANPPDGDSNPQREPVPILSPPENDVMGDRDVDRPSREASPVPSTPAEPANESETDRTLAADVSVETPSDRPSESEARQDTPVLAASVALARFTTAVENHEPVDAISFLDNDQRTVLFYTDLRNLAGSTVIHRWEYQGRVVAEVPFEVGGNRWRIWSSKALSPEWTGDWTASVVAPDGQVLASETFSYQPKP